MNSPSKKLRVISLGELAAVRGRLLGVALLVAAREVGARAIELGLGEAVLLDAQHLGEQAPERVLDLGALDLCDPRERVDLARQPLHADARERERRVGLRRPSTPSRSLRIRSIELLGDDPAEVLRASPRRGAGTR